MLCPFDYLRKIISQYQLFSESTWQEFKACCQLKTVAKNDIVYPVGEIPTCFCFVVTGLFRGYVLDEQGNEYNKTFFSEGRFPGVMSPLLTQQPINLAVQAIEQSTIIEINFAQFRSLMYTNIEVSHFQIHYLETHWLLEKERKEILHLQFEAKDRYLHFIDEHAAIVPRLAQYHIASYLGITPTQLSRIKKDL